jgi:hypothetical protein
VSAEYERAAAELVDLVEWLMGKKPDTVLLKPIVDRAGKMQQPLEAIAEWLAKQEARGYGCPVCRADLLDGKHEVFLTKIGDLPLKVVVCPKVPSGMSWGLSATRPLLRVE